MLLKVGYHVEPEFYPRPPGAKLSDHEAMLLIGDEAIWYSTRDGQQPVWDFGPTTVLQLANASGLPTIPLGDSDRVSVGDAVTVLGNALGRGGPPEASHGSVTALGQTITAADQLLSGFLPKVQRARAASGHPTVTTGSEARDHHV